MFWSEVLPGDMISFKNHDAPPAIVLEKPTTTLTNSDVFIFRVFCPHRFGIEQRWASNAIQMDENVVIFRKKV